MNRFDMANPWEEDPISSKIQELFGIITDKIELVPLDSNFNETKVEKIRTFLDEYKMLYGDDFVKEIIDGLKKELADLKMVYSDIFEFLNNYKVDG